MIFFSTPTPLLFSVFAGGFFFFLVTNHTNSEAATFELSKKSLFELQRSCFLWSSFFGFANIGAHNQEIMQTTHTLIPVLSLLG